MYYTATVYCVYMYISLIIDFLGTRANPKLDLLSRDLIMHVRKEKEEEDRRKKQNKKQEEKNILLTSTTTTSMYY